MAKIPGMPSDEPDAFVEVYWLDNGPEGEPPFVCGFRGGCGGDIIGTIERDLCGDPDEWASRFKKGAGQYLFRAHWYQATPEVAGYWQLAFLSFKAAPTE